MTLDLVLEKCLDSKETNKMNEDDKMEMVLELDCLRLCYLGISVIENLELFTDLKVLYL